MSPSQAISRVVRQNVLPSSTGGKKDCTYCKPKGFTFLPLRYAVVCGLTEEQSKQWPTLGQTLGAGVNDKPLNTSRYTARLLREGYLYVLVERNGSAQWQAYAVTAGGMLARFPAGKPPEAQIPFTCDLATDGVGASLVSVEKIEEVIGIHMLFSPDVVPVSELDKRAKDKLGMQSLPPTNWQGQAHTLKAQELTQWVAEFKLNKDGAQTIATNDPRLTGRAPIAQQLYPLMGGPGVTKPDFDAHGKRLTNLIQKLEQTKSPAIVLWDPIGITQELNRRHRALDEQVEAIIKPHQWELQTSFHIVGLKEHIQAQAAVPPKSVPSNPVLAAKVGLNPDYVQWQRDPHGWVSRNQKAAWDRYESCYDEARRAKLVQQVEEQLKPKFDEAEQRFTELNAWLTSQALVNALDWYATDNVACGKLFEAQVSLCTYALCTSKGGQALLQAWAKDIQVQRTNLINRQLLLNQKVAIDEFKKAASNLQGKPDVNTGTMQTMVSNIAGTFDKAGAIASLAEGGTVPVGMGGIAAKFLLGNQIYATIGQTALQPASGAIDKLYAFLLYLRGGAKAYIQGSADAVIGLFDAAYASKAAVPLERAAELRGKLAQAAADKRSGGLSAVGFGTALAFIESWNLYLKAGAAKGKSGGSRESWELYAAGAATAGAIAVCGANLHKALRTGSVWVEHLSLSSGMLGGFAAGVVAVQSFVDFNAARHDGRLFAASTLFVRGTLNSLAGAGSAFVGVLYSAPLLQRIGTMVGAESRIGKFALSRGERIANFAAREVAFKVIGRVAVRTAAEAVSGVIGWLLIADQVRELAILALEDDPMQVWLTRCRFHKPVDAYRNWWGQVVHDKSAGKPYGSQDEEAAAFEKALRALVGDAKAAQESLLNASRQVVQPALLGAK